MKTCPNCGSKMEADVNFCTVCGTNIKDVPLDGTQPVEQLAPQAPVNPQPQPQQIQSQVQPSQQPQSTDSNTIQSEQAASQPQSSQPQSNQQPQQINDTFSKVSSQITTAVKNFDKESLWKWFVTSWKTPSAQQQGEKWYGIATLLVEMILFSFAGMSAIKKITYEKVSDQVATSDYSGVSQYIQNKITQLVHGLGFDLFLFVFISVIGLIAASYFINKFVHGKTVSVFDYINKIVQLSNISVFLVIAISLVLFMNPMNYKLAFFGLLTLINWLFIFACAFCIKDGPETNRDYFYGVILYIIVMVVIVFIAWEIVKGQMVSQFQSILNVDISPYLDLMKMLGLQ
ncbi:DUF6574 domain-containing protein [Lactobacillus sp. PSON]|uniref:DUF6574 domain-containing protein n=1 Tax=Lactobacillus sp. PSON TaxID=3455454 RepID=UPI004041DF5E